MKITNTEIPDPGKREWDVVVIGTGMGGAVLGYALAKQGKSVLFVEKGKSHLNQNSSLKGDYAEHFFLQIQNQLSFKQVLALSGRCIDEIEDITNEQRYRFMPFIGSGTGGSTALYGMALERFFPSDFAPKKNYPDARESTLPERWPISYDELKPYYVAAEKLFRVRGIGDLLKENEPFDHLLPLPLMTPVAQELHDFFCNKGLHPYRLPLACEFVSGCECCQSYLCDKDCKNDSARICLKPAIDDFGAELIDECEVLKLESARNKVSGVICVHHDKLLSLRGKIVVLAAGALETPKMLLNSASPAWPHGLANESNMIGKNLMRHYIDLYAIIPKTKERYLAKFKEIALNDYYVFKEHKFGTVQSFGAMPPPSIITGDIDKKLRSGALSFMSSLFRIVKPAVEFFISKLFSQRVVLATIMEDLPFKDNLLTLSEKIDNIGRRRLLLRYQINRYEQLRIKAFRKEISRLLEPYPFILIKQAENNERIAHACGTCRFGLNPKDSVLDRNNRAHGISNLYVVDSSFFPSSGGTNPALTIAANALRVADHLRDQ